MTMATGFWVSDTTSIELAVIAEGAHYFDGDTGASYEKDMSGQWWVDTVYEGVFGPFNTLEHACECMQDR